MNCKNCLTKKCDHYHKDYHNDNMAEFKIEHGFVQNWNDDFLIK